MSFRRRLTLFFVSIVVVPMIAVVALLVQVTRESRTGKADVRLAEGLRTALTVYEERVGDSRRLARQIAGETGIAEALREGDREAVRVAARRAVSRGPAIAVIVWNRERAVIARAGSRSPIATSRLLLQGRGGSLGSLQVSGTRARSFLREVKHLTERDAVLLREGAPIAATADVEEAEIPVSGRATLPGGEDLRARSVVLPATAAGATRLALLAPVESGGLTENQTFIAVALLAFFAIAFGFTLLVMRALQDQVGTMFHAARRLGDGDFSREVPVEGNDEMAGLAREFNKMSERLSAQMSQLRSQRAKLEESIRRVGEAFASGLDPDAVLQIVVEAAVDACEADYGRASAGRALELRAEHGRRPEGTPAQVVADAERQAMAESATSTTARGVYHALSSPLDLGSDGTRREPGAMVISRSGQPFTPAQREMFVYLASQAVVSMENAQLHELVAEQAVTDELTGLSNHRRFQELMANEIERANRFNHDLALVMIDIDDFKRVNDTHGHQQGDEVLRRVAAILRRECREIDEPARYGGEELAVALPQTDSAGAYSVAERIRAAVAAEEIGLLGGDGSMRVTASLGIAALPASAFDAASLVAAADAALYRAKRNGKNRTERAEGGVGQAQTAPEG